MSKVGKMLERLVKTFQSNGDFPRGNFMMTGSGLVPVSRGRLNEIPKVIHEHHAQEAERARLLGYIHL